MLLIATYIERDTTNEYAIWYFKHSCVLRFWCFSLQERHFVYTTAIATRSAPPNKTDLLKLYRQNTCVVSPSLKEACLGVPADDAVSWCIVYMPTHGYSTMQPNMLEYDVKCI